MTERTGEVTRSEDGADVDRRATEIERDVLGDEFAESADRDLGAEATPAADASAEADAEAATSRTERVARRAGAVFSPTAFAVHLVAALVGVFVVGDLIPLLPFAGFLGIALLAGTLGTLSAEPRYLEAGAAGGASGGLAVLLGSMTLSVVTGGLLPVAGAAVGALTALVGFYAGRDLRDGLTRDL